MFCIKNRQLHIFICINFELSKFCLVFQYLSNYFLPDVRLHFSKDAGYYIAKIPTTLQGKIRRKTKCCKHLLKEQYFPPGQMTSSNNMRKAKIQIRSLNWTLFSSGTTKEFYSWVKWWSEFRKPQDAVCSLTWKLIHKYHSVNSWILKRH